MNRTFFSLCLALSAIVMLSAENAATSEKKDETMNTIVIFSYNNINPDKKSQYIHPHLNGAVGSSVIASIQEGDLVRVAVYGKKMTFRRSLLHFHNDTGKNLQGVPAGFKHVPGTDNLLFFGDTTLTQIKFESKPIGTDEWPNNMRWRHVWKNYYFITIYRYDSLLVEDLYVERDGKDLLPVMGTSNEHPGERPFTAAWMGGKVAITPAVLKGEELQIYYLKQLDIGELPPDFPEGLVKWVP